ncbi:MFS transporter [Streptomyces minutiscleroticus]|uniref:MFS transporter n=2 Tax=Streptomyces minutiscleroticus TaxID=68238 RepID=A0A918U1Z4_9ACTN|nr:MFS transporter [Streptomyces minutiscleroticus]
MFMVAMPVYVYQLTGSVGATATNFLVELLPALLLSPVAGVLADRWDRRRTMMWVSLAQVAALLPLIAVHGPDQVFIVNIVTAVQAALSTVFQPAKYALLPSLVERQDVPAANGLVSINGNLARLGGASLGGFVLGWFGLAGILVADAASFLLAIVLLLRPFGVSREVPIHQTAWRAYLEGLREIRTRPGLRAMVVTVGLMGLAQGLFAVLFVVFVTDRLGGGESDTGLLRGVQAIGGMVGGGLVGMLARRTEPGRLLGWSLVVFSVMTAATWNSAYLTTSMAWFVGLFSVLGAPGIAAFAGRMSVTQMHTQDATRGRVMASLQSVFDASQALGLICAGTLVAWISLPLALDVQAALLAVAGLLALWNVRQVVEVAEEPERALDTART